MDPKDDEQEQRDTPVIDMAPLLKAWRDSEQQCFVEPDHGDD